LSSEWKAAEALLYHMADTSENLLLRHAGILFSMATTKAC